MTRGKLAGVVVTAAVGFGVVAVLALESGSRYVTTSPDRLSYCGRDYHRGSITERPTAGEQPPGHPLTLRVVGHVGPPYDRRPVLASAPTPSPDGPICPTVIWVGDRQRALSYALSGGP
jgi:hypothetical protein